MTRSSRLSAITTVIVGFYETELARLALLPELEYELERKAAAKRLNNIKLSVLDRLVKARRPKQSGDEDFILPHWDVAPWSTSVSGADLLNDLRAVFHKYIYAPVVIYDAAALWVLHAWTTDAGDISPFFVLVSPTKRCGKTSMLIILMYLTPRSELASNGANIALSSLIRVVGDASASPRQRIRAAAAVLGYKAPDDTAEFVKRYLTSVCENIDVSVDHRIEAGELLRRHEAPRVMSEIVRPNYPDDDNAEPPEPLKDLVARRRERADRMEREMVEQMERERLRLDEAALEQPLDE